MPRRIQYRSDPEWRAPSDAIFCGRPSKYGNPFRIGDPATITTPDWRLDLRIDRTLAIQLFISMVQSEGMEEQIRRDLRGRDLICYCDLFDACHVDFLLETANAPIEEQQTLIN